MGGLQCNLIEGWRFFQALKCKVSTHVTKEFPGMYGIIKFDELLFGNDDRKASLMISDHRPLWAEFEVSVDDD